MRISRGNVDFLLIMPLFIILLWGFALSYAYLFSVHETQQNLWQAGISSWNKKLNGSYQKELEKQNLSHLDVLRSKKLSFNISLLEQIPLSFKIFQQKNTPLKISVSSKKPPYPWLKTMHLWVTDKQLLDITSKRSATFPNSGRLSKKKLFILKHGLWTQGMCKQSFKEILLPLLGVDILLQTAFAVDLPFKTPKPKNLPRIECSI